MNIDSIYDCNRFNNILIAKTLRIPKVLFRKYDKNIVTSTCQHQYKTLREYRYFTVNSVLNSSLQTHIDPIPSIMKLMLRYHHFCQIQHRSNSNDVLFQLRKDYLSFYFILHISKGEMKRKLLIFSHYFNDIFLVLLFC